MSIAVPLYGFGTGGGGAYTGPKVIGSPTQPSNPKDNTVWVQTSTPISSWEMSNVATPGWDTAPAGFVYFTTSTSDWTVPNLVKFVKRNEGNVFLKATRCWQNLGTPGATQWTSMNAYIYHNDTWVQFSSVFSATINITYPAGSTCTCSDGTTTLSAPDTSGTWACIVPNAGTWTVSCAKGSDSDSATVVISTDGQTASCTLTYWDGSVYNSGNQYNSITGGWKTVVQNEKFTFNSNNITFQMGGAEDNHGAIYTTNKIDITGFNYLKVNVSIIDAKTTKFGICGSIGGSEPSYVAYKSVGSSGTLTLDVSSYSGQYHITFNSTMGSGSISRIWLE